MTDEILPSRRGKRNILRPSELQQRKTAVSNNSSLTRTAREAMEDIALRLANTYETERRRHVGMQRPGMTYSPFQFATSVGEIPAEKRRGHEDNIEDNPGGTKRSSVLSVWFKVAEIAIERKLNPETFVRRQFAPLSPGDRPPWPAMFLTADAIVNYTKALIQVEHELDLALKAQARTCWAEINKLAMSSARIVGEDGIIYALCNDDLGMTALFRYTFAIDMLAKEETKNKEMFLRIAERFKEAAALQYLFDIEAYDRVWKTRIPPTFKAEATDIYNRLHGLNTAGEREEF